MLWKHDRAVNDTTEYFNWSSCYSICIHCFINYCSINANNKGEEIKMREDVMLKKWVQEQLREQEKRNKKEKKKTNQN